MIGLEFICSNKGMQYKELAEKIGVSRQSITNWVTGRNKIPDKHLEKLSEILDVAGEWIQKELKEKDKIELLFVLQDNKTNMDIEKFKKLIINNINSYFAKWKTEDIQVNIVLLQMLLDVLDKQMVNVDTIYNVLTALCLANNNTESSTSKFVNIVKQIIEEQEIKSINSILIEDLLDDNSLLKESEIELLIQNDLLKLDREEQIKKLRQYDDKCNRLANKLDILNKLIK